jgi:hypothetical protein
MAALENLEIVVDVDISKAISALERLEEKLDDIADDIDAVDRKHIGIRTHVEGIASELGKLSLLIEEWEAANSIDIDTNIRGSGFSGGGGGVRSATSAIVPNTYASALRGIPDDVGNVERGPLSEFMQAVKSGLPDMENFNLSMSDIHNALARAVPLLITFIGAVPAVVATLYTLAAAAGAAAVGLMALGGLGALGVGLVDGQFDSQRLSDVLSNVRDSFIEAFAPLAERLQPLFLDGVRGLEQLFQTIANQGDVFMSFENEARAFGGFLMEFIPTMIRGISAMANAFSGVFGNIGAFLQQNFIQILRGMTQTALEAMPAVATLGLTLANMLPPLIRLSTGFVMVVDGVLKIIGIFGRFLSLLNISLPMLGALIGTVLTAATAFFLLNSTILTTVYSAIAGFIKSIPLIVTKMFALTQSTTLATLAVNGLRTAIAGLLAITGVGLVIGAVSTLGAKFLSAGNNIRDATDAMKEFKNVSDATNQSDFNPYGRNRDPSDAASAGGAGGVTRTTVVVTGDEEQDNSNFKKSNWTDSRPTGITR